MDGFIATRLDQISSHMPELVHSRQYRPNSSVHRCENTFQRDFPGHPALQWGRDPVLRAAGLRWSVELLFSAIKYQLLVRICRKKLIAMLHCFRVEYCCAMLVQIDVGPIGTSIQNVRTTGALHMMIQPQIDFWFISPLHIVMNWKVFFT